MDEKKKIRFVKNCLLKTILYKKGEVFNFETKKADELVKGKFAELTKK